MAHTRIMIDGRTYDSLEAMPPEVRRAYGELMRQMGPALKDGDGNGIPDVVEGKAGSGRSGGVVVENRIVVNGETYRDSDEMPADVRALYQDAMHRARRGSGVAITREGPALSIGFSHGRVPPAPPGASSLTPRPIEPSTIESCLRTAVVLLAIVVIGGLAAWALLGR